MPVQAQVEGVGTLEFPDGTDPAVVQATVKRVIAQRGTNAPAGETKPPVPATNGAKPATPEPYRSSTALEHADVGLSLASEAVGGVASGLTLAGGYANNLLGINKEDPRPAAAKVGEFFTYHPKTDRGKAVLSDIHKGLEAFEAWTEKAGQDSTAVILAAGKNMAAKAKELGAPDSVVKFIDDHKEQVASAYGSATKTALNAVPAVVGKEVKLPTGARVVGDEAPASTLKPPVAPAAPELSLAPSAPRAAPAAPAPSPAAPAAPLQAAPSPPRGTPTDVGGGALPAPEVPQTPKAKAAAYVRDRLGLSWDALAQGTQEKLTRVAANAQGLDKLNPEAVARQAKLEALRVPLKTTAGKLSRDNPQLLKEQAVAATDAGKPIRDIDAQVNRDLARNVEVLTERLRGQGASKAVATDKEGVGRAVAGREAETPGALKMRERSSEQAYRRKFNEAEKTDPTAEAQAAPLFKFLNENPSVQHTGWLSDWLKKAKVLVPEGAEAANRGVRLNELWDLRKRAVREAGNPANAHYAGEVIQAVDQIMEEGSPAGAAKWKEAIGAFKTHKAEFANTSSVERLVGTKGGRYGTDPKVALEDVWKTSIKGAKIEEVRQVYRSLLKGTTPEERLAGKKALRELKAETGRDLLREITKGVSTDERGNPNITADSINRWINSMGGEEKLNVILGRRATKELYRIREAAQIAKTEPTVRNVGSNTFQKIINWISDAAGSLPESVQSIGGAPIALAKKVYQAGESGRVAKSAGQTATEVAERSGARAAERQAVKIQREQQRRPPTYGDTL